MKKISFDFAPKPPAPPAPPTVPTTFPVNLPEEVLDRKNPSSLFGDMFGNDTSLLAAALGSHWASHDQQQLATQILSGQKKLSALSASDHQLLDELVHGYNDNHEGGAHSHDSVQTGSERLSVSGDDGERGEDLQSRSEDGMQDRSTENGEGPDFSDAYSWTK